MVAENIVSEVEEPTETVVDLVVDLEKVRQSKRRKNQIKRAKRAKRVHPWNPFALHRKVENNNGSITLNSSVNILIPASDGRNVTCMLAAAGWDRISPKQGSPYIMGTAPAGTVIHFAHDRLTFASPGWNPFSLFPLRKGTRISWWITVPYEAKRRRRPRKQRQNRRRS